MAINQILPFGTGAGANVLTPADYTALGARATGFQSGVAKSKEVNTPLRQSAFVAAMIGQFIVDKAGIDVLDDGDVPGLVADFLLALNAQTQSRIASTAQAQALSDDLALLTPKKLADALKGANQSLVTNGYQKLPGGLILQFMAAPQTVNSSATATFPLAFPNACLKALAAESNSTAWFTNNLTVYGTYGATKTQVGVTAYNWSGSAFVQTSNAIANIIAIGY